MHWLTLAKHFYVGVPLFRIHALFLAYTKLPLLLLCFERLLLALGLLSNLKLIHLGTVEILRRAVMETQT